MIATARPIPTRQIRRRDLEQFRQSIESWARQGQEAAREGDVELAAGYAEDVTDLCAILQFIEAAALHEAAEVVNCLGTRWSKTNYSITSMTRSYEETDELAPRNGKPARSDSNPWAHATIGNCAEYWNQTPIPRIAIAMSAPRYKPAESALDSLAFDGDLCREDG